MCRIGIGRPFAGGSRDGARTRGRKHARRPGSRVLAPERGAMTMLQLAAPISGWATPLEDVPDPAFAQKMVGDGITIDPTTSELRAPCDGVVVSLHDAHHACIVRCREGVEVLLHIGIDTVALRGEGFSPLARA